MSTRQKIAFLQTNLKFSRIFPKRKKTFFTVGSFYYQTHQTLESQRHMFFSFNANKEITKLKSGYYGYSTTVCTTVISAMFFYEEKNLATQALKGLSSID